MDWFLYDNGLRHEWVNEVDCNFISNMCLSSKYKREWQINKADRKNHEYFNMFFHKKCINRTWWNRTIWLPQFPIWAVDVGLLQCSWIVVKGASYERYATEPLCKVCIWNNLEVVIAPGSTSGCNTAWKVSNYGVISDPYIPVFGLNTEIYISVFSPNTGKCGPEITPYLDTFQAVQVSHYMEPDAIAIRLLGTLSEC